jgi:nucleoid DNA-binding protein
MALKDYLSAVKVELGQLGITLTNNEVRDVIDVVFGTINDQAKSDSIKIPNFGTFKTKVRPAREARVGRNPSTGEALDIAAAPEKPYLAFKASKQLV